MLDDLHIERLQREGSIETRAGAESVSRLAGSDRIPKEE